MISTWGHWSPRRPLSWLVVALPLWKMMEFVKLGWWHSQYMETNMFQTINQWVLPCVAMRCQVFHFRFVWGATRLRPSSRSWCKSRAAQCWLSAQTRWKKIRKLTLISRWLENHVDPLPKPTAWPFWKAWWILLWVTGLWRLAAMGLLMVIQQKSGWAPPASFRHPSCQEPAAGEKAPLMMGMRRIYIYVR